jgi:hypothetical protein
MYIGVDTKFIADCRLPEIFSRLDLNGTVLSFKMDFMHGWYQKVLSFRDHTGLDTQSAIIFS